MGTPQSTGAMPPLRTWAFGDEETIVLSVYQPAVTIRCGDGPEVRISPKQAARLSEHFDIIEAFFDSGDPEEL
jgi:hypothetical protein